jgi:thiol-disulfide isomerase/thioredoxin
MNRRLFAALFAGLALSVPLASTSMAQPQVVRDSGGARRAALDKMEMQEFPAEAWSKLTGWTGDPIAGGEGKPILVFAWASWHPSSQRALNVAKQMHEKFASKDLVVVGVHAPKGWDKAVETAKARGVEILQAHDASGEFRKLLKIETEPDWYVIDRAGRLRYAAVSTNSVEAAVAEVVNESREDASDLPRVLKDRADKASVEKGRSTDINQQADLSNLPPVPPGYAAPGEQAYEEAKWPKVETELGKAFGLLDQTTGKPLFPELGFEPEAYHPRAPITEGRVTLIYLWHPDLHFTYNGVMDKMDVLQRQYPRDLAIVGAVLPPEKLDPQRANSGQQQDPEEEMEKLLKKYRNFVNARTYEHALAADLSGSAFGSIAQQGSVVFPLPGAMLVSTDGIIRWVGGINGRDFKYAVDTMLANDPGVKARREADRRYIEATRKR